jgi:hypothetical protein
MQVVVSLGAPLLLYPVSILLMALDLTTHILGADEIP